MSRSSGGKALKIGAVTYDPKVVTIWEGFLPYFAKHGAEIDYVLYSNYDAQVEANLSGEIDIAWNSPLAWVKSQIASQGTCVAIAMRDSDRDLTTKIIVRSISQFSSLADLKGKTIAVGASDSPQATDASHYQKKESAASSDFQIHSCPPPVRCREIRAGCRRTRTARSPPTVSFLRETAPRASKDWSRDTARRA